MKVDIEAPYRTRIRQALADTDVRTALERATGQLAERRARAVAAVDNERMRADARAAREEAIRRLPSLLEELERTLTENGSVVHWARDAAEANRIVVEIARASGVESAAKSKSMATEEIHLNKALEAAGIDVVETDLGEYIIQLADEPPSHLVAPVIHKRAEDISELFQRRLGMEPSLDAAVMCDTARQVLRRRFLTADMGISGCNFAIAETGTICLITNEGNGRMVTSLPPVHVVIAGIEQVVSTPEDALLLWQSASRNATGQNVSVYFSMSSGPRRPGHPDGPEEMHVVLLDNGRTRVLERGYADALLCIRCAACLDVCPVYREIGGHAYGQTPYSGPIGSILTPLMADDIGAAKDLPFASSLCGSCKDACPVRIDLPRLLLELRSEIADHGPTTIVERASVKGLILPMLSPRRYRWATWVARRFGRLFGAGSGHLSWLPPPLTAWTRTRVFPRPPAKTFRELWRSGLGEATDRASADEATADSSPPDVAAPVEDE